MKTLVLCRHAKSDWPSGVADIDRPLKERGIKDANRLGTLLGSHDFRTDLIISSPGNRALSTAKLIGQHIKYPEKEIKIDNTVYYEGANNLMNVIEELPNSADTVMIFGHNPTMEQAVRYLLKWNPLFLCLPWAWCVWKDLPRIGKNSESSIFTFAGYRFLVYSEKKINFFVNLQDKDKSIMNYRVLLYYKFVDIADPEAERLAHEAVCKELSLKGRILLASEGINGTVSGLKKDTDAYKAYMQAHPYYAGIEFKEDPYEGHAFNKLHIRVKEEIIRFDIEQLNPSKKTGKYIEPEEFMEVLEKSDVDDDIVIVDTRSDYEFTVGKFKNAITLDIGNFRDLPQKLDELKALKGKKIYTYCTGGIRCEKVTAWMMNEGFEDVYQLHGGIINYGKVTGGKDFEGTCYVFDQRVVVPVNEVNPTVIGTCEVCQGPTEKIINCANAACNKHFLICQSCSDKLEGCCSEACLESPHRREYDGKGYYLKGVNSKNYLQS